MIFPAQDFETNAEAEERMATLAGLPVDDRPEDSDTVLCPRCLGMGVIDLTPGVQDPQLQEDEDCDQCEGWGFLPR